VKINEEVASGILGVPGLDEHRQQIVAELERQKDTRRSDGETL